MTWLCNATLLACYCRYMLCVVQSYLYLCSLPDLKFLTFLIDWKSCMSLMESHCSFLLIQATQSRSVLNFDSAVNLWCELDWDSWDVNPNRQLKLNGYQSIMLHISNRLMEAQQQPSVSLYTSLILIIIHLFQWHWSLTDYLLICSGCSSYWDT